MENAGFREIKGLSLRMTHFPECFAVEALCMCLPYIKRYFQERQWSVFSFMAHMSEIQLFLRKPVLERSKITVWEQHLFKKNVCYGGFRYLSTFRKKVFSRASVKFFFLWGSNNSYSVVFRNAGFRETKDESLRATPFP